MFDHNWKIKYPCVAYRLGTWFGTKVRLVRLQSLGPCKDDYFDTMGIEIIVLIFCQKPLKIADFITLLRKHRL